MSLLSLRNVTKRYPDGGGLATVLDDVSLEVHEGEMLGVWGARRSGKTTLLQIAAGMMQPDHGSVWFDGRNVSGMSADARSRLQRRGGIGLLGGDWRPIRNQQVIEHVALSLLSGGLSLREAREPAWRALERVGISECAHMPADRLSLGERIRASLAQTLARHPRVLLVDEPAALVRPREALELYELLRSLGRESRLSIVIASEELAPIRAADRVLCIDGGMLRAARGPAMLMQLPDGSQGRL